ncbi:MAG: hypothetical protein K0S09_2361 [Sphingobacteriaceae bacterium]|jgi:YhcH/YjgK/YiaL family protein|nr:hypothetical protein [Sphingobacteriaceae bacterium]
MSILRNLILGFFAMTILANCSPSYRRTPVDGPAVNQAYKWLKSGVWKNGFTIKPHPSIDNVAFQQQYTRNKGVWDKAFAFLRDTQLDTLTPGIHPIDGTNAYANVQDVATKDIDKAGWESHRKYIDLQYVIKGTEKFGLAQIAGAVVKSPYDEKRESTTYTVQGGHYFVGDQNVFFLFFPSDVHCPLIKVDGIDRVKKIVIKIKVAE